MNPFIKMKAERDVTVISEFSPIIILHLSIKKSKGSSQSRMTPGCLCLEESGKSGGSRKVLHPYNTQHWPWFKSYKTFWDPAGQCSPKQKRQDTLEEERNTAKKQNVGSFYLLIVVTHFQERRKRNKGSTSLTNRMIMQKKAKRLGQTGPIKQSRRARRKISLQQK